MTATIAERVAAGAAFLDVNDPEWWRADVERAIDLAVLAMSSGERCILGQRCPLSAVPAITRYTAFASKLSGIPAGSWASLDDWAADVGFNVPDDLEITWDGLAAEWARVIRERRSA